MIRNLKIDVYGKRANVRHFALWFNYTIYSKDQKLSTETLFLTTETWRLIF